jgi:hypothetical protein
MRCTLTDPLTSDRLVEIVAGMPLAIPNLRYRMMAKEVVADRAS